MELEWKKVDEHSYKAGYKKFLKRAFSLPSGERRDVDIKDEGKSVCIFAMTMTGNILMTRQYRPGPERILTELPGDFIAFDEEPIVAAKEKLFDETGYEGELEFVCTSFDGAYSNVTRYNFVAKHCVKKSDLHLDLDHAKFIEVIEMSLKNFVAHLRSGQLTNIDTGYLALDYLGIIHFQEKKI
ncbi:MAG: NUDIX hydrolase [Bacteriovorax sp.]